MHPNVNKIQLKKKKVLFWGYDVSVAKVSPDKSIQGQHQQLSKIASKSEIKRVLGVFIVCKGVCLKLARWVQPLQTILKAEKFRVGNEVFNVIQEVWKKVIQFGVSLCLCDKQHAFHLMVDYSTKGWGYVLFASLYKVNR